MKIEGSVLIRADIQKVFETFSDLTTLEKHITGIKSFELLQPPAKMQVGTKWKETRVIFGKEATETMWVTKLDPNKRYVVEAESHGTHYESTYTFTEKEGGTLVHMVFSGTPLTIPARLMSIMGVLFKGATRKLLLQDMHELKDLLERSS